VQRKLNRDGAYFQVNLSWKSEARLQGTRTRLIRRLGIPAPGIAPRPSKSRPAFAPPIKEKKTPYGSKNQKACLSKVSGVSSTEGRGRGPELRDVQSVDLKVFWRTEALYHQAVAAGWLRHSEASFLDWVGAAVRAKTCRASDPVRVFLGIVRRGLWKHITDADEELARLAINRYRQGTEGVGRHIQGLAAPVFSAGC
jgi:hypothetical protein